MIRVLTKIELVEWITTLSQTGAVWILFTGDRLDCIDEAVAFELDSQIVAVATIAPEGEPLGDGSPSIVALYTLKAHRLKGYARQVLKAAIARCAERGFTKIQYNIMSEAQARILVSLAPEERALLVVRELQRIFDDVILCGE